MYVQIILLATNIMRNQQKNANFNNFTQKSPSDDFSQRGHPKNQLLKISLFWGVGDGVEKYYTSYPIPHTCL